jgi:flagellin
MNYSSSVQERLNIQQSQRGPGQSRLAIAIKLLTTWALESSAAISRITDIDVAEETANLVAGNIRQQVAASLLGQSNISQQIALRLLRTDRG